MRIANLIRREAPTSAGTHVVTFLKYTVVVLVVTADRCREFPLEYHVDECVPWCYNMCSGLKIRCLLFCWVIVPDEDDDEFESYQKWTEPEEEIAMTETDISSSPTSSSPE
uniref:ORF3 n=1 Tax=Steinernema glaseri TaxID=37863 RepID=A0A1I7ZDY4_9BILA